jgi:BirA family biotin operon repressor/biotin-[acetyl-CoA-carboxylase] ligase
MEHMELLPLAVGLAVSEACEATASVECRVKWPNDVWIEERKVAGILVEARPQEAWAVIGIGLNVDTTPDELAELRESATSLRIASGSGVDREAALGALFDKLADRLATMEHPDQVIEAFRERDALYGRRIGWSQGTRRMTGEARGVDDHGALVVFTAEGDELRLDAGEVHLEPATPRGGA